ncbi:MAG TPA: FAD-binding oxidoreductase [Candidatus Udaeobacter sp.]|nr:FAD-binding oxidoreductase [Candidatus Udaeobacter sp.]
MKIARLIWRVAFSGLLTILLLVLSYAVLVAHAWFSDPRSSLPEPLLGQSDFGRLTHARPAATIVPDHDPARAIQRLRDLVRQTASQQGKITIAGSRHSMGGHTLLDGSLSIDMRCDVFRHIDPVTTRDSVPFVHVGAGTTWHELLTALDREGWSIPIMQSNDDFTIGGSGSVNCHGWQPNSPPLASTIEAFRILLADGSVRECRRERAEDRELFSAVCGGYGLLGVILDTDLRVVPNALYRAQEFSATSANYTQRFDRLVLHSTEAIGLAYGRVSVAPGPWFLRDARIIRFVATGSNDLQGDVTNTLDNPRRQLAPAAWEINLARAAFRASVDSGFGKLGRWAIERIHGQTHRVVSRNGILRTPSDWFANRNPKYIEILHEYFVPPNKAAEFLDRIRPIVQRMAAIDLLNVTLRFVRQDDDTILAYARQDEVGLVMLFRYLAAPEYDAQMRAITERLIDAALACDGSYYLPYRPHATVQQFQRAYPRWEEFYKTKRKYDPTEVFQNSFYQNYIVPGQNSGAN